LQELMSAEGVDGFKFDAGDLRHYRSDDITGLATARSANVRPGHSWPRNSASTSCELVGRWAANRSRNVYTTNRESGVAADSVP
jgi:hypothetical protein